MSRARHLHRLLPQYQLQALPPLRKLTATVNHLDKMKSIILLLAILYGLLAASPIKGVSTSQRKNSRKQAVPFRAPLSDTQGGNVAQHAAAPKMLRSSGSRPAFRIKPTFKPSSGRLLISKASKVKYYPFRGRDKGKGTVSSEYETTSIDSASISSDSSSWDSVGKEAEASTSSSSVAAAAAFRTARYQNERKVDKTARQKAQAALFQLKWNTLKPSYKDISIDQMADLIQGIEVADMTRVAISRKAMANLGTDGATRDYLFQLKKTLNKKANVASVLRFRERVKPVAQRRTYKRKMKKHKQDQE